MNSLRNPIIANMWKTLEPQNLTLLDSNMSLLIRTIFPLQYIKKNTFTDLGTN